MKLPNFDEFEPLNAVRQQMDAGRGAALSLLNIDRLQNIDVESTKADWTPLETTPLPPSPTAAPKQSPAAKTEPARSPPPLQSAPPTISPPHKIAAPKPTQKNAVRPSSPKRPHKKSAKKYTWLFAAMALCVPLVVLFGILNTLHKKERAVVAPPAVKPHIIQATPQTIKPTPEQKTNTTTTVPPAALPPTPAPETIASPEPRKSFPKHQDSAKPTEATIQTPAVQNMKLPQSSEPESEEEGLRASEMLPHPQQQPAQQPPKPPSDYDINTMPFSDALRYSGRDWYTKVEKRKKPSHDEF